MAENEKLPVRVLFSVGGAIVAAGVVSIVVRFVVVPSTPSGVSPFTSTLLNATQKANADLADKLQRDQANARQTALDKEAQERQAKAQAERERNAAQQDAIDAANRAADAKEAAWKKFYAPSTNCQSYDSRATMECANEHVKAKREFDALWAAGKLPGASEN